jgi:hypothetical protein
MSKEKEKFYFDPVYKNLVKDDGVWFFVYENGNWVRNRYYEGILMGDCWCDPNRVGSRPLLGRETSHITVRTVRYTAIPNFTSHSHNSHLATGREFMPDVNKL